MTTGTLQRPATDTKLEMEVERRPSLKLTAQQTMTLAWRSVKKMQRTPEQFSDVLIQPVLFTLMFAYIFAGAVSGDVEDYLPLMIPGILAIPTLSACISSDVQVDEVFVMAVV